MTEETVIKKEFTCYRCLKCGHEWIPKYKEKIPNTCPNYKCRSHDWMKPKGYRKPYEWKDPVKKTWIGRKDKKEKTIEKEA